MAGRKRVPSELKRLKGTDQPCRMNPDEPKPEKPSNLNCPDWFSEDKVALGMWEWVTELLQRTKVLTEADLPTVEMLCITYADIRQIWKDLRKEGRVAYTQKMDSLGNEVMEVKANPKATQLNNLLTQYRQFASSLGLDPASRPKISTNKDDEPDELTKFINARA